MNTRTLAMALVLSTCLGCRFAASPAPALVRAEMIDASLPAAASETREPQPITAVSETQPTEDHLSSAATCVERGNEQGALVHLKAHVAEHPEQPMIRIYLAELLFKTHRYAEAQWHYEQFVADAQRAERTLGKKLVHCHTRLMEIGQLRDDSYAEHLHRGIGFVLLSRQLDAGLREPEPGFHERILCKAVAELQTARKARPGEARPLCYLYEVYRNLEQPRPAERARELAKSQALFSTLTPIEKQSMLE